jgi:hypothetical protein
MAWVCWATASPETNRGFWFPETSFFSSQADAEPRPPGWNPAAGDLTCPGAGTSPLAVRDAFPPAPRPQWPFVAESLLFVSVRATGYTVRQKVAK